ncbi:murein hydrolase activator EnvC [Asticcacaulis sp. AND118]|uniref:murein hydrolase activator EnvC family protein n=1 Tax=Asticcacaulis sp. AND118 TaxID=2840468 RepID=UPI001CFF8FC3|nr:peptidoglycan DD-metalloendopeptidase family protein [Asticcacaulis sp. AND118]UDF03759.1 peptidoglycan DD-metalloendopeptidase family protein [Asticcacaulis sp. AND118]
MIRRPVLLRAARPVALTLLVLFGTGTGTIDLWAQPVQKPLTKQAQTELDTIGAELRANARKREQKHQSARQIAEEMERLRTQMIDIARTQGASEKRAAIYRSRLETLTLLEADMTRRLGTLRNKQSRLLSALQIYSRNPPPTIFVSTRKANDAVIAAIILKEITPELKKRAAVLSEQNRDLIRVRREAALQNEALFISESDVSEQQKQLETLMADRAALEDQLLREADAIEARNLELEARQRTLLGLPSPLRAPQGRALDLQLPVVGEKAGSYGESIDGQTNRGLRLKTAPGAQVRSPGNGRVEYAGPLEGYGQVVILDVGGDYRIVMTGLGRVYVDPNRTVAKGEPLGRTPNLTDKPTIFYMELRKGENPVNPASGFDLTKL